MYLYSESKNTDCNTVEKAVRVIHLMRTITFMRSKTNIVKVV